MYVKISGYPKTFSVGLYDWYLEHRYKVEFAWQYEGAADKLDRFVEKINDLLQLCLDSTINKITSFRERKVVVRIDEQDTWSMDTTLAHIIVPMLKQLNETKHGSPNVDVEDVPENLRDSDVHNRWQWVLHEMIWAFEQLKDNTTIWEFTYHQIDEQREWLARKDNGLRLFGKYYNGLWN